MKIFNVIDFLTFVESNEDVYFNESYGEIKKIVNENGNGVYSLMYGSRGEVEFVKVNLVDELVEWNKVRMNNEFCFLEGGWNEKELDSCLLYTSPSPRDNGRSRMPSSA